MQLNQKYILCQSDIDPDIFSTDTFSPTAVGAINKEVLVNTETVISCKINGSNEQMSIEWSGCTPGQNFDQKQGSYDSSSNSQTGTLTVKSAAVSQDRTYTCTVSSIKFPSSANKAVDVSLDVYGNCDLKVPLHFAILLYFAV